MNIDSRDGTQFVSLDDEDSAEGLSIFFSQEGGAVSRFRVRVKARIDQGLYDVGEFYTSPPLATAPPGRLSRMVAAAVCPGAVGWALEINLITQPNQESIPEEVADIVLASSKCCTAPVGLSRVGERYQYAAGTGTVNYSVLAGQKITGIGAIGLTGGGSIVINGGATILVPEGISANPEPKAPIPPNSVIVFTNVDYAVEYLESA